MFLRVPPGRADEHEQRGAMSDLPPPYDEWRAPDTSKPWGSPGGPPSPPSSLSRTPPPPPTPGGWGAPPPVYSTGYGVPGRSSWQPPPKPGVIPLHPLGLGELLDGAVQTLRQNPRVMLGLSAAVMAVAGVLSTVFMVAGLPRMMSALDPSGGPVSPAEIANLVGGGVASVLIPVALQVLAVVVLSGVLTLAVSEAVLGRRPTVGQVWAKARPRVLALIGLSLLTALLSTVAVTALVGPGIALLAVSGAAGAIALLVGVPAAVAMVVWISVRLAFAAPALLLEDLGVVAAMRRSWRLVDRSWWRVLGVLLVMTIIAAVINGLLQTPFSVIGLVVATALSGDASASTAQLGPAMLLNAGITNIGGVVASTVSAPFAAAVTALLYIDLRIRREGLDVALARAAQA